MIRTFLLLAALFGSSRAVAEDEADSQPPELYFEGLLRLQAKVRVGLAAPSLSKRERRHQRWERVFGPGTFRVSRTRYRDGMLLASESIDLKGNKPLCVTLPQFDQRPLAVRSYHEEGVDPDIPVFFIESPDQRVIVVPLRPGEHLISYEAIDTRPGEGLQVIRVERATTILEITETTEHEEVCLKRNDLNLEKKKKKKKKKQQTTTTETPPSS